jgi:hypothetical protein
VARQCSRPNVDGELLRQIHQPLLLYEAVDRHLLVALGHAGDGVLEVVDGVLMGERRLGIFQGDPLPRGTGHPPDRLEHRVQDGPGEILLGVGQLRRIVRACCTAQGKEPLAL